MAEMLPLGRITTEAGEAIRDRLLKTAAGCLRSAVILQVGDYDGLDFHKQAREAKRMVEDDPDLEAKTAKAVERFKHKNDAR